MPYSAPYTKNSIAARCSPRWELVAALRKRKMTYIIEVLRQEHRNIESLLRVLERDLSVFDRGERPDYEVVLAVIDYFKESVAGRRKRTSHLLYHSATLALCNIGRVLVARRGFHRDGTDRSR
jgi:hypothetical protein